MEEDLELFSFFSVARKVHNHVSKKFEALGLHRGQPRLINLLRERDGQSLGELADGLHREMATVSKMVKRMECSGYVYKSRDENDSRKSRIHLTDKGRDAGGMIDEFHNDLNEVLCSVLDDSEKESFLKILKKIDKGLDKGDWHR